jgi:hypothetical protein
MQTTELDTLFAGLALRGYIGITNRSGKGSYARVDFLVPSKELGEAAVKNFGTGRVVERTNGRFAYKVQGREALQVIERLEPHLIGAYRRQASTILDNNAPVRKDLRNDEN